MKKYILFDQDGVLVDTEHWYYKAGERALAEFGLPLDPDQYLLDMSQGAGTWAQAKAAGVDDRTIDRLREVRNAHYQEYLRTEAIEIDGVVEALADAVARRDCVRDASTVLTPYRRPDRVARQEHRPASGIRARNHRAGPRT